MEQITSRSNETVKFMSNLCESTKARKESGLCAVFGIKLCEEAVRFGCEIESLWITEQANDKYVFELEPIKAAAKRIFLMSESVCDKIAPQKSPQGIAAAVRIPNPIPLQKASESKRILLLCSVQDPANVGTMIRTAAALGYESVVVSKDSADVYSPKALRASMGAVFATGIAVCEDMAGALRTLQENGVTIIAAALNENAIKIGEIKKTEHMALAIGNEGNGLQRNLIEIADVTAMIPITNRVESLNAASAASIAMWELGK